MAECPICKEKVGANDFLPSADAACSVCGNRPLSPPEPEPWWVSAAALEQKGPAVTQLAPPETKVAPEPDKPETVPATPTPSPPPSPRPVPSTSRLPPRPVSTDTDDDEEPLSWLDRLRHIDFGSALAFLCFGVALLFVSFYQVEAFIKPTAALGLAAGLLLGVLPALWRRKKLFLPLVMSLLCLLVLLFVGSWPSSAPPPPQLVTVQLKQKGMVAHQPAGEDDWVDASANALKRGDVRVEIASASIGPVDLKKGSSSLASSERFLTIRVRVSCESIIFQRTPYEPWADRAESASKNPPTLTDNQGRTYTQKKFDPGWKVVGRADVDALNPGHQVKEVLVYPVPARDVKHLRLTLPASAFGLDGAFRFEIPRSMIRGL
jgi:hypothetical protein